MKNTESRREFDDACGIAHALELVGERWGLLVLRELLFGPRRFSDLKADLPGITPSVLTQRLTEFEERGLVRKLRLPPPASVQVYEATRWGRDIEQALIVLGCWALRSPRHDPTKPVNASSVMLSLKANFDRSKAKGFRARVAFHLGAQTFTVSVRDGRVEVKRGETAGCEVVFTGPPEGVVATMFLGAKDALAVEGDAALAKRFTEMFCLPPQETQ